MKILVNPIARSENVDSLLVLIMKKYHLLISIHYINYVYTKLSIMTQSEKEHIWSVSGYITIQLNLSLIYQQK